MGSFCMEKRQPSFTKQQKSQTISQKCWGFILETFLLACRGRTASLRGKATPLPSSSVRFQAGFNSGLAQRFPPGRCWGGGGASLLRPQGRDGDKAGPGPSAMTNPSPRRMGGGVSVILMGGGRLQKTLLAPLPGGRPAKSPPPPLSKHRLGLTSRTAIGSRAEAESLRSQVAEAGAGRLKHLPRSGTGAERWAQPR